MKNLRKYGIAPFNIAVIHGGPGAVGEMAPVARELAALSGVLEPLQTKMTLNRQVVELREALENHGNFPVSLVGFSWGAWLSYITTAQHPALVKKLILVGSGPYEPQFVNHIQKTRLSRLNEEERAEYESIIIKLNDPHEKDKARLFSRLGQLAHKTDQYDPIENILPTSEKPEDERNAKPSNKFHGVLREVQELRQNGSLLELAEDIQCPVVAVHGDYDPHPIAGVAQPLSNKLRDFHIIKIDRCGHKPWIERQAKSKFFKILKEELLGA